MKCTYGLRSVMENNVALASHKYIFLSYCREIFIEMSISIALDSCNSTISRERNTL